MKAIGSMALAAAALVHATAGQATTFNEIGDAGALPGSAQILGNIASGDNILGTISTLSDVDMFGFTVGAGVLTVNTFAAPSISDPQLVLLNAAGELLYFNDDAVGLESQISVNVAAGSYFVAVAGLFAEPRNAANESILFHSGSNSSNDLFGSQVYTPVVGDAVVTSWGNGSFSGDYNITFAAAETAVPLPATAAMFGLGLAGIGLATRRRRAA